jgi:hypothetical protein
MAPEATATPLLSTQGETDEINCSTHDSPTA